MKNEQDKNIINRIDDIESAINNLDCSSYDYTQELRGIWDELFHMGTGSMGDGCLTRIANALEKLNKNIIVAALIQSNATNHEKLLAKCSDMADKFSEYNKVYPLKKKRG